MFDPILPIDVGSLGVSVHGLETRGIAEAVDRERRLPLLDIAPPRRV